MLLGQREVQLEPVSQILDLAADCCGHGFGERGVLVDGVDPQHPGLAVGGGIELAPHALSRRTQARQEA